MLKGQLQRLLRLMELEAQVVQHGINNLDRVDLCLSSSPAEQRNVPVRLDATLRHALAVASQDLR